jgi:surfactin synthase thioesterase subunit
MQLVCFPHIGGSASFYRTLSAALAPAVEVLAVQYPGRQDRSDEKPATDLQELAEGAFEALRPMLDAKVALFGHSMGSLVAFEVVRRMEQLTGVAPAALIASGMWAPSRRREGELLTKDLDDMDGLIADLKRLRGTDSGLLDNEDLMHRIALAIRSDYIAVDSYRCAPEVSVTCPVAVFVGDRDPHVSMEAAHAWSGHTTGGFDLRVFAGDHFYLTNLQTAVARELSEVLQAAM